MRRPAVALLVCLAGTVGAGAFVLSGGSGSGSTGSTVTLQPVAAPVQHLTSAPSRLTLRESLLRELQLFLRDRGPLAPVATPRAILRSRSLPPRKIAPLLPQSGMACPVASTGGCSIVPCIEYAGSAVASVATPVTSSAVGNAVGLVHTTLAPIAAVPPSAGRPKTCLPRPGTTTHPYRVSVGSR
jgi:hypothetical protein